jgi:hypothetical protein
MMKQAEYLNHLYTLDLGFEMQERQEEELREKQLFTLVDRATNKVKQKLNQLEPPIVGAISYGAIGIHPRHLAIWWMFDDAEAVKTARQRGLHELLQRETLTALAQVGYPTEFLSENSIGFAPADEIVKAGGPYNYFR